MSNHCFKFIVFFFFLCLCFLSLWLHLMFQIDPIWTWPDQRRPDKRRCIHVDNICAISNMNLLCRAGWTIVRMPHSSSNSCGSELNIQNFLYAHEYLCVFNACIHTCMSTVVSWALLAPCWYRLWGKQEMEHGVRSAHHWLPNHVAAKPECTSHQCFPLNGYVL